uniref:Uncharacterized protein n=1 Tax=Rhizophora mucronata TaxID=61149 RepID=A0A2P2PDI2_RHIMU
MPKGVSHSNLWLRMNSNLFIKTYCNNHA